ncbi:MAG: D-alanyl-D-alanine carboxypeptidase [Pyrinomonadaceae bacterium]
MMRFSALPSMLIRVARFFVLISVAGSIVFNVQNSATAQVPETRPTPNAAQSIPGVKPPAEEQPASESRPLYGVQGVLVETLDGETVATQSEHVPLNPASAVKLATALVALQTFGPQHRFSTGVWSDGAFDKESGTINGNLYLSGRDPSFHYEHAILLARELNRLGIKRVTGDLIVPPGFTMNFSWSARGSGEQLYVTFDATLRSEAATRAWTYERTLLDDHASLESNPSVAVMGEVVVGNVSAAAKLLLTQKSSKLVDILKVLLCYSNNFMAERIGETLGGPNSVQQQLVTKLGVDPEELRLSSLSGLGINRISPYVMMKIVRGLRIELEKQNLSPADIMPVAGIDPGTMKDRFTGLAWRGSVIAKTGTLVRTDGGASALVGQMKTASGQELLFVIINQSGSVSRFRENQDLFVMQIQNSRGGPKAFKYTPRQLAMELSDTEVRVSTSDEYETGSKLRSP